MGEAGTRTILRLDVAWHLLLPCVGLNNKAECAVCGSALFDCAGSNLWSGPATSSLLPTPDFKPFALVALKEPDVTARSDHAADVSFEPSCRQAFVRTSDGRVVKYTEELRAFDLPYSIPVFWQRANGSFDE